MKSIIAKTAILSFLAASCNYNSTTTKNSPRSTDSNKTVVNLQAGSASTADILTAYLQLKNALSNDNSSLAALAAMALHAALGSFNKKALADSQRIKFEDIQDEASEHAEHIGKNAGNIAHQRMHFESLSEDIYDLVKIFGAGQILYMDFCPMYDQGKGASWISESKDIKNPYLGKSMPTCGVVKEEIK